MSKSSPVVLLLQSGAPLSLQSSTDKVLSLAFEAISQIRSKLAGRGEERESGSRRGGRRGSRGSCRRVGAIPIKAQHIRQRSGRVCAADFVFLGSWFGGIRKS